MVYIKQSIVIPPTKRLIRFKYHDVTTLTFPYTVFWVGPYFKHLDYSTVHIGFSNDPDFYFSQLYIPPLPHIDYDGTVCISDTQIYSSTPKTNEELKKFITLFFNSPFKKEYHLQANHIANTSLRTFQKWEKLTKEKPLSYFTSNVNWGIKVRDLGI